MQPLRTPKPDSAQGDRPSIDDAWFDASVKIDNGTAIAELARQSLIGSAFSGETINEQRALDGAIAILKEVGDFFGEYRLEVSERTAAQPAPPTVDNDHISDDFRDAMDRHRWAWERVQDTVLTTDKLNPRYDPSAEAQTAHREAEREEEESLMALCRYQAFSRLERYKKAEYLGDLHRAGELQDKHIEALLDNSVW
jgi:hypothetical protein